MLLRLWYGKARYLKLPVFLLLPLSRLFRYLAGRRRRRLQAIQPQLPVPVVVVGNITVGGTGKTPVVIALVRALAGQGITAGVVTRGYGNKPVGGAIILNEQTPIEQSGDEACLIYRETHCPLAVGRDRVAAAQLLIERFPQVQLIVSDDGLQHYRLPRQREIAVIDGDRGLGNAHCLPAGPLREAPERLKSVDWVLVNGVWPHAMDQPSALADIAMTAIHFQPLQWLHLKSRRVLPLTPLPWSAEQTVTAVAAIGNPQRFFATLERLGITAREQVFDDHHDFTADDFATIRDDVILMTTKDAVKCADFARENWWALEGSVTLPTPLVADIKALI